MTPTPGHDAGATPEDVAPPAMVWVQRALVVALAYGVAAKVCLLLPTAAAAGALLWCPLGVLIALWSAAAGTKALDRRTWRAVVEVCGTAP